MESRHKHWDIITVSKYVAMRLSGQSPVETLLQLGFIGCRFRFKQYALYKLGEEEIRKLLIKQGLDSESSIKKFKGILVKKLELEEEVLNEALESNDFKKKLLVLSKSKDNITDFAKLIRLLEGESTENVNLVSKEEYQYESNRLNSILQQNAGKPSSPAQN